MADVKWIKIVTDIFDDEKILLIEQMPEADTVLVLWFKLLCLAGKTNNSGIVMLSDKIAYTDEMLSAIFRRPLNTVRLALSTFERFGMIEIVNNIITVSNWEKHQNEAKLESLREYNRIAKQREREKKKALLCQGQVNDSQYTDIDIDIDIDRDKDKEDKGDSGEERQPHIPYQEIAEMYNNICVSLSKCTRVSERRKKAIRARINSGYTLEQLRQAFTKAQASSFLRGSNQRNWAATFDWLIEDGNLAKVLDGNYDDKENSNGSNESGQLAAKSQLNVTRL